LVIAGAGCALTTTMREGPARPAAEQARVESTDTIIAQIDGKDVGDIGPDPNAKIVYLLPAGPHVLAFGLRKKPHLLSHTVWRSRYVRVCLLAEAGHLYTTAAEVGVSTWRPHIVDGAAGEVPLTCGRARIFPSAAPPPDERPAAESASPYPPPPPDPAQDVSAGPEIVRLWSKDEIAPQKGRPIVDVIASVGWAFGGDEVARLQSSSGGSQTLTAGKGPFFRAGALVTPLWLAADRVGIGAGGDVAFKLDDVSASNVEVSFIRYPCSLTLHTRLRFKPFWYVLVAGGVNKDEGIHLSGSGDASGIGAASLTSRIGGVGRLGAYWADTDAFALMAGLEYTRLAYDAPGGSVRADSVGFSLTFTWRAL
jgi:hypothetical protein